MIPVLKPITVQVRQMNHRLWELEAKRLDGSISLEEEVELEGICREIEGDASNEARAGRASHRALFHGLRRSGACRYRKGSIMTDIETAQRLLDQLGGTSADFGFFYHGERRVYSCSIRLLSGDLAYGTGPSLPKAVEAAQTHEPIRSQEAA